MEESIVNGRGSVTGGIAYSAVVFAYILISLIFSVIVTACGLSSSSPVYVYISYLIAPVAVGATLPIVLKKRRVPFRMLVPVRTEPRYCLIAVLLAFGLLFSVSWLNVGFLKLLELCGYNYSGLNLDLSGGMIVPALVVVALIPALFEETLFRGVLLNNIERDTGTVNAVFICGFCFALFHANPVQTVYQFVCGCAFALLAVRSRSVVPCMIAHFLNNAVILILGACGLDTDGTVFDWAPLWAAVLVTVLSALCFICAVLLLIKEKKLVAKPVRGGVKWFFLSAAAGITALAIMWLVTLLL